MFKFKIYNSIAEEGINELLDDGYCIDDDDPDAILLRSHKLGSKDIGNNLKCIARAGAGTNNIPTDEASKKRYCSFQYPWR